MIIFLYIVRYYYYSLSQVFMLKKRIIPCLDVKNGRTVKGVNFVNLKDAGDSIDLAKKYDISGADELVFLDISATNEGRETMLEFVKSVAKNISIPFTVGGGISSLESAKKVIFSGADKVGINSAAVRNPQIINDIAKEFGNQAVVLAIDAKKTKVTASGWEVFISGGKKATGLDLLEWAKKGVSLGAGEILLTSMDRDGVKTGFDIDMLQALEKEIDVPIIASGGAGKIEDFLEVFKNTNVTGALAASVFHFAEIEILDLKHYLLENNIIVRLG